MQRLANLAIGIIALAVGASLGLAMLWRFSEPVAAVLTGGALVLAGVMANSIASGIRLSLHDRELAGRRGPLDQTFNLPAGVGQPMLPGPAPYTDVTKIIDVTNGGRPWDAN